MKNKEFVLTGDHIKLLRHSYVEWSDKPYNGGFCVDTKRPYGTTGTLLKIAKIIGLEIFEDAEGEEYLNGKQQALCLKLHQETATSLQIVLATGTFKPGTYKREDEYNALSWKDV